MVSKETGKLSSFDRMCIFIYAQADLEIHLLSWLLPHPMYQFAFSEIIRIGAMSG